MLYVLQYIKLRNAIKQTLDVSFFFFFFWFTKDELPIIPNTISVYFNNKKGCTDMHKQFIRYKISCITCFKKKEKERPL